jgi:hypothetical protein
MSHGNYGWIYILKSPEGYRKIGKTINPGQRVAQITPALPFKVQEEFWFICALGNEGRVERLLHEKFKTKRTNGEWFKLNDEDMRWFYQDPLPLPIAVSHSICYSQDCLKHHNPDHIMEQMLGLS